MPKAKKLTELEEHRRACETCQEVDTEYSATLANVCNRGAPFLRDHLSKIATKSRPRAERDSDVAPQYVVRERYTTTEIDPKTKEPVEVEKEKTISPVYLRSDTANEFLQLARKTGGGDQSRFFVTQR